MSSIRLNKAMAILGLCSRRIADSLIKSGEIKVNGITINKLGTKITESDVITFHDKHYSIKGNSPTSKVWLYYKKRGFITSYKDEIGRPTIFNDIGDKIKERVIYVGRLDYNSEGLLLLTNDRIFANHATSPITGWERIYRVRIFGNLTPEMINEIENGIIIKGISYKPLKLRVLDFISSKNKWCECTLTEGKNREIRKIFEHFGIMVNKLIRYSYGPYNLGSMKPGEVKKSKIIL